MGTTFIILVIIALAFLIVATIVLFAMGTSDNDDYNGKAYVGLAILTSFVLIMFCSTLISYGELDGQLHNYKVINIQNVELIKENNELREENKNKDVLIGVLKDYSIRVQKEN